MSPASEARLRGRIRLGLAEIEDVQPGRRIIDATVNGVTVFSGLDLVAEHGPFVAVERAGRVIASGESGVVVRLTALKGETIISSLHLRRR